MPVPLFQTIMLPLLQLAADGYEHENREALATLAEQFGLTPEERAQQLKSGKQPLFDNRAHWARSYLKHAGLIESTGRARFRITPRGQSVLAANPPAIDNALLRQFPEFIAFITGANGKAPLTPPPGLTPPVETTTPEEQLEESHEQLRSAVANDLLERVRRVSPPFFERLVLDLLVKMGYGGSFEDAARAVGRSGDGGIDGIIKEDRLGLDAIYVQAKRWSGRTVGEPDVRDFAGSLMKHKASKGVFITTAEFTAGALDYVTHLVQKIVLIGGTELARLMIDYGVGVTEAAVYRVYRVDSDYFDEA